MFSDIDPLVITVALVAVAVVGTCIGVARRARSAPAPARTTLPAGADAALWSITEVLPDPRNHLAIKDPTSELRLTARERAEAAEAAASTTAAPSASPAVRPAEAARSAQSLAARRAALAKRSGAASPPEAPAAAAGTPHVIEAAPSSIELVQATSLDQPLTIFLDEADGADPRHLTLLPEDLPEAVPAAPDADAPTAGRWGESPARAS
jgi:hypothetical protein